MCGRRDSVRSRNDSRLGHRVSDESIDNPILNGPYDPPERHFELGSQGPTGTIVMGRRPSESYIPIPPLRKGHHREEQFAIDFDITGERRERNSLINDIRRHVELWRARGYSGVTPVSRKLLQHWADPDREDRMLFCQREAAETAIFLAEVAGRHGTPDYRRRVDEQNRLHNPGLPRVGLKMATGSGKTVVMAMLIAWQTANKVFTPNDPRFAKRFLVVTPGITIRDRLRVILPTEDVNYYRERDLVPPELWSAVLEAQVVITNYHAFLPRTAKEMQGVASGTKKLLLGDRPRGSADPFVETPDQMVARVLRDFSASRGAGGEIVVLNDEAHHCYRERPLDEPVEVEDKKEAEQRNEDARVWFKGLQAVRRKVGIKVIYDLSATPFYLGGSGWVDGYIFPWVVSDFSLMDAIESGVVKVPRIPVDDDAKDKLITYLRLWDHVGPVLPKKKGKTAGTEASWVPPDELAGALLSLYRSYARRFEDWERRLGPLGEPPPVLIVVCPNTIVSKLVYDWIAGVTVQRGDGTKIVRGGALELLSNEEDGLWRQRPRSILVDSAQLESGEAMSDDFRKAAAPEVESFKAELRKRNPGVDVETLSDEELLREVMNTVGKRGKLGEGVRCVVSVAMLTEGWDANTVTHILGIRRFGSQLLCEQVVGRGLRRRSYAVNEQGRFEPEYAEVYGVPFAFIPADRVPGPDKPLSPAVEVRALPDRYDLRISFPKVDGYRVEVSEDPSFPDLSMAPRWTPDLGAVATWTEVRGVVGVAEEHDLDDLREARRQYVAFHVARGVVRDKLAALDGARRPWLFPFILEVTRAWMDQCLTLDPGQFDGLLLLPELGNEAAEQVYNLIANSMGNRHEKLQPVLRRFDASGSTDEVRFVTRKSLIDTVKSPVSHVVLDGPTGGNTWEEKVAGILEAHSAVTSFVKNDHLGFEIPYIHQGRTHRYVPDFLVRLHQSVDDPVERHLIVEVSGSRKSPGPTRAKATTARDQWCVAVNNQGGSGCWAYVEISDIGDATTLINDAIATLYTDVSVVGSPV